MIYDFDMFSIVPKDLQPISCRQGLPRQMAAQQMALFRDPDTVGALLRADDEVRDMFVSAGFGLRPWRSGAPSGFYRTEDSYGRTRTMMRLSDLLQQARPEIDTVDWAGFEMQALTDCYATARPMTEVEMMAHSQARAREIPPSGPGAGLQILRATSTFMASFVVYGCLGTMLA